MSLGKRIIEARGAMSRSELSRRSGVPYPTLAGIENGDQKRSTYAVALAATLGVHALWLETGRGPKWLNESGSTAESPNLQPPSHSATLDPDILHEALTLLLWDIDHGGPRSARTATPLLMQLYERIQAAGGRLPAEEQEAFEQAARARRQGQNDGNELSRRRTARRRK